MKAAASKGQRPQGEGRSYAGEFLKPVLAREATGRRKKKVMQAAEWDFPFSCNLFFCNLAPGVFKFCGKLVWRGGSLQCVLS